MGGDGAIRAPRGGDGAEAGALILQVWMYAEGVCTDEFLSRKPGFLLSAMHSHTFRWFSAALLVFLFLGLLPLQLNQIWRIFCVMYEKKVGGLYLIVCKNYNSLTCLNVFFALFNLDNI